MEIQEICIKMDARKWRALKPLSPICRVFPAILLFLFALCVPALNARADSDKDIQKQLEANLRKAPLTIRHFYSGDTLVYNSDGVLVKGGKPGPWTLNAFFEPKKINLSKNKILISGKRIWWIYNDSEKTPVLLRSSNNLKIEIRRSSEQNDLAGILASLQTIFLKGDESLADFVPSYWKKLVYENFEHIPRKSPSNQDRCAINNCSNERISLPVQNILVTPGYTEEALRVMLRGCIYLKTVIDEDGKAKILEILKPLGAGLEDNAIRTIEETWKFSPATFDGVPFTIDSVIEVCFGLSDSPKR